MNFLNAGYGNFVSISRVLTVVCPDSAPIKRYINKLRETDISLQAVSSVQDHSRHLKAYVQIRLLERGKLRAARLL